MTLTPEEPPPPEPSRSEPPPPGPVIFEAAPPSPRTVTNTYDHARSTWGLGDMLFSLCAFFVGSVTLILAIVAITDSDDFLKGPWLLVGVVGPHALLLAHLLWVSRTKGLGLSSDFQFRVTWSDLGVGVTMFFAALVGAGIVAAVITELLGEAPTASAIEAAQESTGADGGLTIWLYLFALLGATFVPVVEELVYRGLFWSALEKRGMHPWAILVGTSFVFAIIHLEPVRTPVLFVVGVAIGVGRLRTGRVGASIITHMLINALAMIATLVQLA